MNSKTLQFEKASRECMDAIYTRAIRLTKNGPRAEELVQITFFQAFNTFSRFDGTIDFKSWLLSMLNKIYEERFAEAQKDILNAGQGIAAVS